MTTVDDSLIKMLRKQRLSKIDPVSKSAPGMLIAFQGRRDIPELNADYLGLVIQVVEITNRENCIRLVK